MIYLGGKSGGKPGVSVHKFSRLQLGDDLHHVLLDVAIVSGHGTGKFSQPNLLAVARIQVLKVKTLV